jgi:DNA-binding response OmpR family regulator
VTDKVLVVDDDPDIARFIEVNLRTQGFEVHLAADGVEALERARDTLPDLVLVDVMMPRMDGFQVVDRLRSEPRTANVSIIMLTAKALTADKVLGITTGADDYIIKPFDPIELVARVKGTLRRAREMRAMSPLTGLPGNARIQQELQRRIVNHCVEVGGWDSRPMSRTARTALASDPVAASRYLASKEQRIALSPEGEL